MGILSTRTLALCVYVLGDLHAHAAFSKSRIYRLSLIYLVDVNTAMNMWSRLKKYILNHKKENI